MSSLCVLTVAKVAIDSEQHVKTEPEWSAAAGKQSNTCRGSPHSPRCPGYKVTHRESLPARRRPGNTCSRSPCGRRRPGYRATRATRATWPPAPCRSKGVLFVGLLESSPVMITSAYARSNPTSMTCTPISMVVVGCATPSLSHRCRPIS